MQATTIHAGSQITLLRTYEASGGARMLSGDTFRVLAVFEDGGVHLGHPLTGAPICFGKSEVVPFIPKSKALKKPERFYRVSAFEVGQSDVTRPPALHKRSRVRQRVEVQFQSLAKQIGTKYQTVILHQGNLAANSAKIFQRVDIS